jgi:integrase
MQNATMDCADSFPKFSKVSVLKMSTERVQKLDSSTRLPKTDIRYWQKAVCRREYLYKGQLTQVPFYSVRLRCLGRQIEFPLGTPNKAAAAAKAREIYLFLAANGAEKTLAKYKPETEPKIEGTVETVGQLIGAIEATSSSRGRTLPEYIRAFRRIVADSFGIDDPKKYDYRAGGRDRWLAQINAVPLAKITPQRIQRWKIDFLARAGQNPTEQRTSKISANSTLRAARNLFSAKRLKFISLPPVFVSPFTGVQFEPRQSMRYHSGFDVEALVVAAVKELADSQSDALKALLLSTLCGLRRGEIDRLTWSAFDFDKKTLHIGVTEHFRPKSEDSIGKINLDPELAELFKRLKAKSKQEFVIESPIAPRPNARYAHYRCLSVFETLTQWLRKHNVPGSKPIHALRKEFGCLINARFGIYAASRALRHSDIAVTSAHYLDQKSATTTGLGHLLY